MYQAKLTENVGVMPDEELFAASREHPSLFGFIVDRYQVAFLRKARQVVKSHDDAEDVVQDTFVKLYRKSHLFTSRGPGSFRSWAYRVLVNTSLSFATQRMGKVALELSDELEEIIPDSSADKNAATRELRDYIESVLTRLPPEKASLLRRFFIEGKSQEEIAREDGVSVGAVKVRMFRAKAAFRDADLLVA